MKGQIKMILDQVKSVFLKSIVIEGFRSIIYTEISFLKNISLIIGPRGTGKTTLLELISLLDRIYNQKSTIIQSLPDIYELSPKITYKFDLIQNGNPNQVVEIALFDQNNVKVESNLGESLKKNDFLDFLKKNFKVLNVDTNLVNNRKKRNDFLSNGQSAFKNLNQIFDKSNNIDNHIILVDEVFGNLDVSQTKQILEKINFLGKNNQIIMCLNSYQPKLYLDSFSDSHIMEFTDNRYLIDSIKNNTNFYSNFNENIQNINNLVDQKDFNRDINNMILKMSYLHLITCLETYLSDALINTVKNDKNFQRKVIETDPQFENDSRSTKKLFTIFLNIEDFVINHLSNHIFHNLSKISIIYQNVLDVSFPEEMGDIYRAIYIRHDLVHRNGKTKKGKLIEIRKKDVIALADSVDVFIRFIDNQIKKIF